MKVDVIQTSFVTVVNFTLSGDSKDLTLKTFNSVDDSSSRFIDHLQLLHRNTQSADPLDAISLFNEIHGNQIESPDSINDIIEDDVENNDKTPEDQIPASDELPNKEVSCGCANHMEKRSVNTIIPIDCALAFDLMFGPKCPIQHAIQIRRKNRSKSEFYYLKYL